MRRKILFFLILALILVPLVKAEEGQNSTTNKVIPTMSEEQIRQKQEYIERMKAEKQALLETMKATEKARKLELREKITLMPKVTEAESEDESEELETEGETLKSEIREMVQTRLEERKESLEQKREEFRERVSEIRNEKKQEILEHLESQLNQINKRLVEQLLTKVERLEELLTKLEEASLNLKEEGGNTTEAEALIAAAKSSLETFETALLAQAEKTYTPTLTTEENFRTDVGEQHQALRNDLNLLRTDLMAIKNQFVKIAQLLRSIKHTLEVTPTVVPVITP